MRRRGPYPFDELAQRDSPRRRRRGKTERLLLTREPQCDIHRTLREAVAIIDPGVARRIPRIGAAQIGEVARRARMDIQRRCASAGCASKQAINAKAASGAGNFMQSLLAATMR